MHTIPQNRVLSSKTSVVVPSNAVLSAEGLHQFAVMLDEMPNISISLQKWLRFIGCEDATIDVMDGTVFLEFLRESPSREEAIASALEDLSMAGANGMLIE